MKESSEYPEKEWTAQMNEAFDAAEEQCDFPQKVTRGACRKTSACFLFVVDQLDKRMKSGLLRNAAEHLNLQLVALELSTGQLYIPAMWGAPYVSDRLYRHVLTLLSMYTKTSNPT